jgi:hypothetical protein
MLKWWLIITPIVLSYPKLTTCFFGNYRWNEILRKCFCTFIVEHVFKNISSNMINVFLICELFGSFLNPMVNLWACIAKENNYMNNNFVLHCYFNAYSITFIYSKIEYIWHNSMKVSWIWLSSVLYWISIPLVKHLQQVFLICLGDTMLN